MIGVIITLGEAEDGIAPANSPSRTNPGADLVKWDVLGESVLQRFLRNLEAIAPQQVAFLSDTLSSSEGNSSYVTSFTLTPCAPFSSWEEAAQAFVSQGIQTLLLVKLNQYIEVDLADFLKFHDATASKLTQVFVGNQPISLVLVQASELRAKGTSLRRQLAETIPQRRRYQFNGYLNPLRGLDDFRRLCDDAFADVCSLRPVGQEIAPGLYAGEDAFIHSTVTVTGPAYIGARATVAAGCVISGPVALEHGCEIDCGTSLENCFVTHNTYVGPGLNLKNALAGPGWLYNLEHKTVLTIHDPRLLGETRSLNFLNRAKSLLSQSWPQRSLSTFR
ncbi:MAG TPA: hypothetical protein VGG46_09150 [Terriglobales bacterium]|jgi:hypothetical protein